ncbi:thioredoxin-like domain-containing protein [Variovorax paradoxus B4]|uniref:Thioredoxin-like domain-containing protein n=1 Tax=Variovorax paradoxus B4 TaxID=1246301 RepID=T1XGJ5_VARPD|nr:cytochrome c biogenesis protein CcdA [Variovorax paradoxus]AGU51668.1 thioredoxin-like domain-containing protein [Variovorax paradoxus B4]
MLILLIAYLGGVLTILSPCILPVLPFVFARADRPFRSHGLPMLLGMALAFAAVATLAAVGGGWIVALNEYGRHAAIAMLALFGVTLLFPSVADRISRPLVALGIRMSEPRGDGGAAPAPVFSPLLLGVGTGLLWAPCAGPILGLILTGAALNGASVGTSLLLLAYAAGACTSLAAALLFGGRLFSVMKRSLHTGEWVRRAAGAAVLAGVGAIALGLDTGLLARLSLGTTSALEQALVDRIKPRNAQPAREPQAEPVALREDAGLVRVSESRTAPVPARELKVEGRFPSLAGATGWLNSAPLAPEALRGKVVLVDFWTYSCINCLRTLPYLRAWAEKYKDAGLVVIGVHSPEFAFEKQPANVRKAVRDLGIGFPVAMDNDFAIWRGFDNQAWPAFYFIDAEGHIRHHQFGENRYDKAEQVIQQLLAEAGQTRIAAGLVAPLGQGTQAAPGAEPALSGETYLGHERAHGFASPGGIARDHAKVYQPASSPLRTNQWALAGDWTVEAERAVLNSANGRIAYRFQARDLHLVLGPAANGKPVRFRVLVDGKPPLADHGSDTDAQGHGVIDAQKLYQLVRQAASGRERLFEIEFLDAGAQAYAFTFG